MGTIANLIVSLKADIADYKKNINDAKAVTTEFAKGTMKDSGKAKSALGGISEGYKSVAIAAAGLMATYYTLKKVVAATVGEFVKYADQVENLHRLSGMSYEDTSRLIQASDDLFVSQQTLESALEFAIRQGYQPSVAWIKQMADQIMAIPDPAERAKQAIKMFGRQAGPEMQKLLEQGGQGLQDYIDKIDDSLIMTAEGRQKALEYKQAIDELNDSIYALKIAAGEKLIPIITKLATTETRITGIHKKLTHEIWNTLDPLEKSVILFVALNTLPVGGLKTLAHILFKNIPEGAEKSGYGIDSLTNYVSDMDAVMRAAAGGAGDLTEQFSFVADYIGDYQTMADKQAELKTKIEEATGAHGPLSQEVKDLQADYQKVGEDAELAFRKMILGAQETQMMLDGIVTPEEIARWEALATGLDIYTDSEIAAALEGWELYSAIGAIQSLDDIKRFSIIVDIIGDMGSAMELMAAWTSLPSDVQAHLTEDLGSSAPYNPAAGGLLTLAPWATEADKAYARAHPELYAPVGEASGGDWLVREPTLFLAGEAGPERATFSPMNKMETRIETGRGDIYIYVTPHYYKGSEPTLLEELKLIGKLREI